MLSLAPHSSHILSSPSFAFRGRHSGFPFGPIFCILLRHFNLSHVLSHRIHKPPFGPSRFIFPGSCILSILSPNNISIIYPRYLQVQTTPVLPLMFSPFLSLLTKIVTSFNSAILPTLMLSIPSHNCATVIVSGDSTIVCV